jgi:hypothetical protein
VLQAPEEPRVGLGEEATRGDAWVVERRGGERVHVDIVPMVVAFARTKG